MGWNIIRDTEGRVLYDGMGAEPRFYFDHSYYFTAVASEHVCGTATHGVTFAAGIRRGNIFGVQFHPEKSHRFGVALFTNFITFARSAAAHPLTLREPQGSEERRVGKEGVRTFRSRWLP